MEGEGKRREQGKGEVFGMVREAGRSMMPGPTAAAAPGGYCYWWPALRHAMPRHATPLSSQQIILTRKDKQSQTDYAAAEMGLQSGRLLERLKEPREGGGAGRGAAGALLSGTREGNVSCCRTGTARHGTAPRGGSRKNRSRLRLLGAGRARRASFQAALPALLRFHSSRTPSRLQTHT